ncbi:potassium-transporting ATPase subunit KdpA, partial [Streptomyces noursei]|uniref:potassium-transporting ATPase subunit KdpA n=1 Tax=Streptomyces noursei TaxID=1971 RepID=UPI00362F80D1
MGDTAAGWLQVTALVVALGLSYRPLGDGLAHVLTTERHWRVERLVYRAGGVNGDVDQRWPVYLRGLLAFGLVSVLFLYAFLRLQDHLMLSLGHEPVPADLAFNTAASFVTNTNWQAYSGESTMGHLVQMAGLAVQNFVSAAMGIAVVAALLRGFTRQRTQQVGNFWADLTRGRVAVRGRLAFVFALVLVAAGVIQNLHGAHELVTVAGGHQSLPGGPVASQESIKELGTNGGGFFNANSAHPFENPSGLTNLIEIYLMLVIPFALPRTFGAMVGDHRQGYAVVAVMVVLWA